MSDSVRPHRRQSIRLHRPWDSPGKNTGVGCHFLLQWMKVKSLSRVRLFANAWTAAYQAPPSMGFSPLGKKWEYPYIPVLLHLDSSLFWPPPHFLNHMIKQNLRENTQIMSEWVKSLSHVQLFTTPWTVAHQLPLSMGFSRQEYWRGLPFPSPGYLPDPRIERGVLSLMRNRVWSKQI